jgi:hypothetical protein
MTQIVSLTGRTERTMRGHQDKANYFFISESINQMKEKLILGVIILFICFYLSQGNDNMK